MRPRVVALIVILLLPLTFAARSAVAEEPSVAVRSRIQVGFPVTAVVSGVTGDVSYVWTLDGVPTVQETFPTGAQRPEDRFFLYEDYVGKSLSVTAVVTPAVGDPITLVSVPQVIAAPGPMLVNYPTVSGKLMEGEVLTANHGVLYPTEGVTIEYNWSLGGSTGSTLKLGPQHVGFAYPTVWVTASKPGWETSWHWSDQPLSAVVMPIQIRPGLVRVAGEIRPYSQVVAQPVGWDEFESLSDKYQWLLDGRPMPGKTAATLQLDPAWSGRKVSVQMTRTRLDGSSTATVTSPQEDVRPAYFTANDFGQYTGRQAVVGWPLSFTPNPLGKGETRSYQWIRLDYNNYETIIPGATGTRYRISAGDIGYKIGIRVTMSAPGYGTSSWRFNTPNSTILNVYTTPGTHTVNGRTWRTACEPYSQTVRCRAEIWATQVLKMNGRYTRVTGWAFNNLSYMPLTGGGWGNNPLANTTEWSDTQHRRWKTECERGTCRTYIELFVATAHPQGDQWRYSGSTQWVFNNIVYLH